MFSEYASKFLQQSQTRMSAIREGRLNISAAAPLFHSAADFLPEDPEHERDFQDLYALKSSRRHFGAYATSQNPRSYNDDDDGHYSEDSIPELHSRVPGYGRYQGPGNRLKSSWRMSESKHKQSTSSLSSDGTQRAFVSKGKGKLLDVQLGASNQTGSIDESDRMMTHSPDHRDSFPGNDTHSIEQRQGAGDELDDPPQDIRIQIRDNEEVSLSFQSFNRKTQLTSPLPFASQPNNESEHENTPFIGGNNQNKQNGTFASAHCSQVPEQIRYPRLEPPSHDHPWGNIYILCMACLIATSFVVWLYTEEPVSVKPVDTIYSLLHRWIHLLAIDTLIAIVVALTWMFLLRSFVRPLILGILYSVPFILLSFSIFLFTMSFKTPDKTYRGQDRAMQWGSFVPALVAASWVYTAWTRRDSLQRAIGIIQLSCRILGDNPALIIFSFGTLILTCAVTWIWVGMFTRAFLTGNVLVKGILIWSLNRTTVALGVFYVIMYSWTLGVISGLHRATSSASVSQWYFHRHILPTPTSKQVTSAAFSHSTSTLFGSVCFHAFTTLVARFPLIIAPGKISRIIHLFMFQFLSAPIAALINPLTLTYSAIHSQPIVASSRVIVGRYSNDNSGYGTGGHISAAYRLSKMILLAARGVTAFTLGIGAWTAAARNANDGSVYGYVVGLIAGSIGWTILGATEGCISNVVDGVLVCVVSEDGASSHCREAQLVFGG